MQHTGSVVVLFLFTALFLNSAHAQQEHPWFASIDFGEGQLKLTSDQYKGTYGPTFAFSIAGGHRLGSHARAGLQINGWLLEAFDLYDPTKGTSVSNVFGIIDVFPSRKHAFFVRGGGGLSIYTNNHLDGNGGHGPGWTAGAGYEIPVTRQFKVAPIVAYSAGQFGDAAIPLQTSRRYSVIEFRAALTWHFGRSK